jgi:hypothetical protein
MNTLAAQEHELEIQWAIKQAHREKAAVRTTRTDERKLQ